MTSSEPLAATEVPPHRSGFCCFIGRPNVGKSTLLNALVGSPIAITADQPQTTRRAIRGIVTRPYAQLVVVDTPGLHKPRTLLGERLDDLARSVLADVDVIGLCVPADEKVGPGDRRIVADMRELAPRVPAVGILTKTDKVSRERVFAGLSALAELNDFAEVVPVSARDDFQVGLLADLVVAHLPEGPPLYPDAELTDEPMDTRIAEIVREAALDGVRDELPHSIAVLVDERNPRPGSDLTDVYATIFVERSSQKAIVLGRGGSRLAAVGRRARARIEPLLGTRVYLNLHVTVAADWQRDAKQLRKLGFES